MKELKAMSDLKLGLSPRKLVVNKENDDNKNSKD